MSRMQAYSEALSEAISQDPTTGCRILTVAKAYAYARCGPTGAFAQSGSSTTQVSAGATQTSTSSDV